LRALGPGWTVDAAALPEPGAWQAWRVTARRGEESRELALKLKLWPCERVRVLNRDLPAGAALEGADLAWELKDPRALAGLPLVGPLASGGRMARPRRRGEALLQGDLTRVLLPAGAPVRLRVRFNGGEASDQGFLLEDGVEGRRLRAEHGRSGKVVTGQLVDGALLVED
jgi:flagella basal body P-ring formation protein FlgA